MKRIVSLILALVLLVGILPLTAQAATKVSITTQPKSVTVAEGEKATVKVVAKGDGLIYRWYYKDAGASKYTYTSSFSGNTYTVAMNAARNGRRVLCKVWDKYGNSVQSQSVSLNMAAKKVATIVTQPKSVTVAEGEKATVTVKATGDGLIYRWYFKDAGASKYTYTSSFSGNTYTVAMNAARDGRRVLCKIWDKYGNAVQTQSVSLNMAAKKNVATIVTQPQSVTVAEGEKAAVKVVATGDGLTYRWYYKDAGASDYTYTSSFKGNTYTVVMSAARNGRRVLCKVTDKYGNMVQSKSVTLNMAPAVAVPQNVPAAVKLQNTRVLQGKKIGCSIVYKGDEWCAALAEALETLGQYYGAELICQDGDLDIDKQALQIEKMIANDVDMMMIDPIIPMDKCSTALSKAANADIPIIIYDGYWELGAEKAETTVTWDQKDCGRVTGQYFVDYVKKHCGGKATVVELTNAISTHCQNRYEGFHEVIEKANANGCKITILDQYDSMGSAEVGHEIIAGITEPYDFVISDVNNPADGACGALSVAGNTHVKVLSMGGYGFSGFSRIYYREGNPNYLACLNVDPWIMAQYIFDAAINYFTGVDNPAQTHIALYMVDSSNLSKFYDVNKFASAAG